MTLKDKLSSELKSAMKEKNETRRNVLRLALTSIKLAEVEKGDQLDDLKILGILQKEIKTREETIFEAKKLDRTEMIASLESEIEVIKGFLPVEMSDEDLEVIISKIIVDTKADSIKQMGLVMKQAIDEVAGRASNDRISKIVKSKLI